jgi:hypothetical protein
MTGLIEPSENLKEVYLELGVASGTQLIQKFGTLAGALEAIREVSGESIEATTGLFNNINAVEGVLAITARQGENFARVQEIMADAAGSTNRALSEQAQGFDFQMTLMKNSIEALRIEFGQALLPLIQPVVEKMTALLEVFGNLPGPIKTTLAAGALLTTALTALAGIVLISSLRKRLYVEALKRLPPALAQTRTATMLTTVAERGLIRSSILAAQHLSMKSMRLAQVTQKMTSTGVASRVLGGRLNKLANDWFMLSNRVFAATNNMQRAGNIAASVGRNLARAGGLGLEALMMWTTYTSTLQSHAAEAEASVSEMMGAFDTTTMEGSQKAMEALLGTLRAMGQVSDPGFGLSAISDAASSLTGIGTDEWGQHLALTEELEAQYMALAGRANVLAGAAYGLQHEFGLTTEQFERFLGSTTEGQELIALLNQTMNDERVRSGAMTMREVLEEQGISVHDLSRELSDLYPIWLANDGAAGTFEDQLASLNDPIAQFTNSTMELNDAQKAWLSTLQAIGAADFGEQLSRKKDVIGEFADILEKDGRQAAENFAEDMLSLGTITEDTFEHLMNRDLGADVWRQLNENTQLGIEDYISSLNQANARLAQWEQDMLLIGSRAGSDFSEVVTGYLNSLGDAAPEAAHAMANATDEEFMRMVDAIKTNTEKTGPEAAVEMDAAMRIIEEAGRRGAAATAEGIAEELGVGVGAVRAIALEYGQALAGGINPVLVALGQQTITVRSGPERYYRTGNVIRRAGGGGVPGRGEGDTVPAMLTPGEFVIRKKAAEALGLNNLHKLNRADQRRVQFFAEGGFVTAADVPPAPDVSGEPFGFMLDAQIESALGALQERVSKFMEKNSFLLGGAQGSTTGLDPVFLQRFNAYNAALGGILRIISGFRSRAQQTSLYNRYLAGVPGQAPAAKPGSSQHERGLAIDHAPHSNASMRSRASGYRLWYPMGYEPWHVEPFETKKFDKGGLLQPGYTLAYNGTGRPELVAKFANGGQALAGGHATVNWQNTMVGNLSGTRVGQHILAANKDNPEQARRDLERLLELYVEISDRLGQATADEMVFYNTGLDGLEALAEATLAAADAADALAAEHMRINDVKFEIGEISAERYLEILNQRLAATEKYSEEWLDLWNQINDVTEQAAEEEREILETRLDTLSEELSAAEEQLEEHISNFESAYSSAQDRFLNQQQAYEEAVAERARRIQEEIGSFRQGLVDSFRELTNPLAIFQGDKNVTAAEVTAALRHRVRATQRFAAVYQQLVAKGFSQEVLTDLAQQGPQALSLANALLKIDPALVNEAMSQTSQIGGGIADIALGWERARIEQEVYADIALPMMQDFNTLLQEELDLMEEREAREAEARTWAEAMAEQVYPALTAQVRALRLEQEALNAAMAAGSGGGGTGNWGSSATETPEQRAARIASQVLGNTRTFDQVRQSLGLATGVAGAGVDAAALAGGQAAVEARIIQMLQNAGQWYDNGGWLQPGMTVAFNGTGFPERVGGPVVSILVERGAFQFAGAAGTGSTATMEAMLRQGLQELKRDILRKVRA